jgi:4'-phosphopantetheinyl transferase EntD
MLREIIQTEVAVCETAKSFSQFILFQQEKDSLGPCVDKRLQEFAAGRACASSALKQLGYPRRPIVRGNNREPIWPSGVVGSITHCEGYCAAAVANAAEVGSIGIDAELPGPLPDGSLSLIAFDEELAMLSGLPNDGISWDRLLFSAKECLFKAWYPIEKAWLGFEDARIKFEPQHRTFTATVVRSASSVLFQRPVTGKFASNTERLVTALVLPAD